MAKRKSSPKQIDKAAAATSQPAGNPLKKYVWAVFALGFLVYANTLFFDYALDDSIVITNNEFTTQGAAGIPGLLKYDTFRGFFKVKGKENLVAGGRYRPLTPVMYALEVQAFAPKKRDATGQIIKHQNGNEVYDPKAGGAVKFVGHLVNVLLFALTGALLFLLLFKMLSPPTGSGKTSDYALFVSLAATLLFVVHPLHTEAVANIKGRDEIISLLGSLAALWLSLRAFYEKKPMLNVAAGLVFCLAMFSKENGITFLAIVPLTYYFFTKAKMGQIVRQTVPFLAGAAVFLFVRSLVLGWDMGDGASRELMNNPFLKLVGNQYVDFSFGEKTATIFYTLGKYLQLLVFPYPLTHDYYPKAIGMMTFGDWQAILSLLLYMCMGVYALIRLPKKDPVSYGILFYLATLSIVSNLVFPIGTFMNERFLFMPSIGFCLVAAVLAHRLTKGKGLQARPVVMAGCVVLAIFAVLTVVRNFAWKDNFTLFTTDIKISENSAKLQSSVGESLIERATQTENKDTKMLQEAIGHLNKAIEIHPFYKVPFQLIGNANFHLKNWDGAVKAYQEALKRDPGFVDAYKNMGIALREAHQWDASAEALKEAMRLRPDDPEGKAYLLFTYSEAGRYLGEKEGNLNLAVQYLQKGLEVDPNDFECLRLMGVVHAVGGQYQIALDYLQKALALQPNNANVLQNIGTTYMSAGQPEKAQEFMQKAKAANPDLGK